MQWLALIMKNTCRAELSCQLVWKYLSLITVLVLVGNSLSACLFTIECELYLTTFSEAGSLMDHYQYQTPVLVVCGLVFNLVGVLVSVKVVGKVGLVDRCMIHILSFGVGGLIITAVLLDERNGIFFVMIDAVHTYITLALVVVGTYWGYITLTLLDGLELSRPQRDWLEKSRKVFTYGVLAVLIAMLEWSLLGSVYDNFLITKPAEALSEYVTVGIAFYFVYCIIGALDASAEFNFDWRAKKKDRVNSGPTIL